ncbi:hypothetical protein D9M72_573420 [compost metagenome]
MKKSQNLYSPPIPFGLNPSVFMAIATIAVKMNIISSFPATVPMPSKTNWSKTESKAKLSSLSKEEEES